MHSDLEPLLKTLPPKTKSALIQAINICSTKLHMEFDWVQRWLSFTIVADALASYAPGGMLAFEFKGGAAIEMRMRRLKVDTAPDEVSTTPITPRATRDLDAAFRGELDGIASAVEAALSEPRHGFAFRTEIETPDAKNMIRFRVRVSYLQTGVGGLSPHLLSSVKLEVSRYEGTHYPPDMVPAFSLKPFGIDGPSHLPCMALPKQIAQKLHAVTEIPEEGKTNDRFRDLIDIVMLSVLVSPSPELRAVCEETFRIRKKHSWPPNVVVNPEWIEPMEQRAREMGLTTTTADEIIAFVTNYVNNIVLV
jgi:Nucleotidyl transferase AbiEii toxin, Type IV TA system